MASEDLRGKPPEEIPFPASHESGVTPLRDCFLIKGYTVCPSRYGPPSLSAFLSPVPPPTKSKKANFGASSPPSLGTPVSPASGSPVFPQPHSSPCLVLVLWQLILQHLPAKCEEATLPGQGVTHGPLLLPRVVPEGKLHGSK